MPMIFARPRMLRFDSNAVTDHNRSELGVSIERIGNRKRMANGTMRQYYIADKRTWTVSWDNTPSTSAKTVDGYWGPKDIKNFVESTSGSFTLGITDKNGVEVNYTVMFTDISYDIVKRWASDEYWNISVTMEEV